jgi:hypothetical protein
MHSATKFTLATAVVFIIILVLVFALRDNLKPKENLTPYRGSPSGRFSYSAADWEDPQWSNIFALRGVGGNIPDECHADTVGPDVARLHPEDLDFAKQNGIKLSPPGGSSKVIDTRSETGADEGFTCSALGAEEAAATMSVRRKVPYVATGSNPLLNINKALSQKKWDPVIVSDNGYSTKV